MTIFKYALEYEIDYSHSEATIFDYVWLFGNAGDVGTLPTSIPDLKGNAPLTIVNSNGSGKLVGDGAINFNNGVSGNQDYGNIGTDVRYSQNPTQGSLNDRSDNKNLTVYLDIVVGTFPSSVDQYLFDGGGLVIKLQETGGNRELYVKFKPNNDASNYVTFIAPLGLPSEVENQRYKILFNFDTASASLSQLYINGLFVDQFTGYTWSYTGNPFTVSPTIPQEEIWIGKYNNSNSFRFNGYFNMVAVGFQHTKTGNTSALRQMTIDEYPMIQRKQGTIKHALKFDSSKSQNVSFQGLDYTNVSGYNWTLEIHGKCDPHLVVGKSDNTSYWIQVFNSGSLNFGNANNILTWTGLPTDSGYHSYKLHVKDNNCTLYVDDVLISSQTHISAYPIPYYDSLMRFGASTYYNGIIQWFKYTDHNNANNNRFYNFNLTNATTVLCDANDVYPATLNNFSTGGYQYGFGDSDGLQGDGTLYATFPEWTASQGFNVRLLLQGGNGNSSEFILGKLASNSIFIYAVDGKDIGFNWNGLVPAAPNWTMASEQFYEITFKRINRQALPELTLKRISDGFTVTWTHHTAQDADCVFDAFFNTLGSNVGTRYRGKILEADFIEDGGDNRSYNFSDIALGQITETLQGKHAYVKDAPANTVYSPESKDKFLGYKGGGSASEYMSFNNLFSATGAFRLTGSFVVGDYVNHHYFYGNNSNTVLQLYLGHTLHFYNESPSIVNSDVLTAGLHSFVLERDISGNVTLSIDGSIVDTGNNSSTFTVNYFGRIANNYSDRGFMVGVWTMDNFAGDRREYDFTTGDATSIIDRNSGKHATINNANTDGFTPIINKEVFTIGASPHDYQTIQASIDANKASTAYEAEVLITDGTYQESITINDTDFTAYRPTFKPMNAGMVTIESTNNKVNRGKIDGIKFKLPSGG